MKVIRVDNYGDEGPRGTQRLIRDGLSPDEARELADRLNDDPLRADVDYFLAVNDNEPLWTFCP